MDDIVSSAKSASVEATDETNRPHPPVMTVAWMVGFSALFLCGCIETQMSFGAGIAVAAVAAMVAVIACVMLKGRN